ncbi:hypothetical protein Cylst_2278 [Cylindrospermum stagnale PCC 7417]|uniref:Uncharacterized protein n=1 Tax=Cylindrospermum stagnale PCC 7417 TaxID=56107 RepID=K9WWA9_9NOST|nr:hypothetical protein [Cylindrospermum stagnale]AFZ24508.1 hypothetical protein Cylst_2278 [Cylindrospermum stagnale PCC 7417]
MGVTEMAKLKINELKAAGTELFEDSETFLDELSNDELENAIGGRRIYPTGGRPTIVGTPGKITPGCPFTRRTFGGLTTRYSPVVL